MNNDKFVRKNTNFILPALTAIYICAYAFASIFMMKQLGSPISGLPFTLAADIVFFVILYIGSDVFSQVYGYKISRWTASLAAGITVSIGIIGKLLTYIPALPGNEWADEIFNAIYGGNFYVTIVGVIVFFIGDWINDIIFKKYREKHNNSMKFKHFAFRSIFSSFVGRLVDVALFTLLCNLVINAPSLGLPEPFQSIHHFLRLEDWHQSMYVIMVSGICTAIVQPIMELCFSPLSLMVCKKTIKIEDAAGNSMLE